MEDRASTDQDEGSCILMVTVSGQFAEWVSRKEAYIWALRIVRKATQDAGAMWEGDLRTVVPLRATIAGLKLKLIFVGVSESLMSSVLIPAFEKEGQVKRLTHAEVMLDQSQSKAKALDRSTRAKIIGNVAATNATIDRSLLLKLLNLLRQ